MFDFTKRDVRDSDRYFVVGTVLRTLEDLDDTITKTRTGERIYVSLTDKQLQSLFDEATSLELQLVKWAKVDKRFRGKKSRSSPIYDPVSSQWDPFYEEIITAHMRRLGHDCAHKPLSPDLVG